MEIVKIKLPEVVCESCGFTIKFYPHSADCINCPNCGKRIDLK